MDPSPQTVQNPFGGWKREQVLWVVVIILGLLVLAAWFIKLETPGPAPLPTGIVSGTPSPSPSAVATVLATLEELPYESTPSDIDMNPGELALATVPGADGEGPTETPTWYVRPLTTNTPTPGRNAPYSYNFPTATPYFYLTQYYQTATSFARTATARYRKTATLMGPTWAAGTQYARETATFVAFAATIAAKPRPQQVAFDDGNSIFLSVTTPFPTSVATPMPIISAPAVMGDWHPGGLRMVYVSGGRLFSQSINVDGTRNGDPTEIRNQPSDGANLQPTWSHNGAWIVFRHEGANPGLYRISMSTDGKNDGRFVQQLTNNPNDEMPDWSPDSTKIVFVSGGETSPDIFFINVSPAQPYIPPSTVTPVATRTPTAVPTLVQNLTQLTRTGGRESWPHYSPDGRYLIYAREDGGHSDIYMLDLGSPFIGDPQNLTQGQPGNQFEPFWTRDTTRFLFISDRSGTRDLYIQDRFNNAAPLPPGSGDEFHPRWRP